MVLGGPHSFLVIFEPSDTERTAVITATRREPIWDEYKVHDGKSWLSFEWRTRSAADAARARVAAAKERGDVSKWTWVGQVRTNQFFGGK